MWAGLAAGLLLLTGTSQAHFVQDDEHGVIEVEVDDRTDPCMGTVHLSQLDFQNGTIEMYLDRGSRPPPLLLETKSFNATASEGGYAASVGGFEMGEGWRYYFLVESDTEERHAFRSDFIAVGHGDCGDPEDEPCFEVELTGTANADGSITLDVDGLDPGQEGALWKTSIGEHAEEIATLTAQNDTFVDSDTEVGTSYFYSVFVDSDTCDRIEVTAIPFFPSVMAGVAGVAAMSLGYVALRRRR